MKFVTVTGNVYTHIDWLEEHVGPFFETSATGNLVGVGWKLIFVHDKEGYHVDQQKVYIENDMLATEFILVFG